jgi:hypothetical protein
MGSSVVLYHLNWRVKMDKEKDEISTRLRLPADLHHKLARLAVAENRSLHNYMIQVLTDHVATFENKLLETFGEKDFDNIYIGIFGTEHDPYMFDFDMKINPSLFRGLQISTKRNPRPRVRDSKVAEETPKYDIEFNDDDKPDNS